MLQEKIKKDFPVLNQKFYGRNFIFLDSAATTQKPKQVIEKIKEYYEKYNSNVHRGIYKISVEASKEYEGSRERVRKFINANSTKEIIFTKNATESINLVAYSYSRLLKKGDEILLSKMEHHSNIVPWQLMAKRHGFKLRFIDVNKDGTLGQIKFNKNTRIISITQMSNVLGTINNVKDIAKKAHKNNCIIIVDAAQSVPHMKVDVQDLDADFLVFSGHKMLASTGIGILYGKENLLEKMEPFLAGGDMIKEVALENTTYNDLPWKFEAGTQNIEGVISLKAAIEYLEGIGMKKIELHEKELLKYALEKIQKIRDIEIHSSLNAEKKGCIISFNIKGIHPHDVATILDEQGIAVRSGHHCCQPLMNLLNISGSCRASFYIYNTKKDVDALIKGLEKANYIFKKQNGL
ncbi:MAG: cysteine desulfurase [Nanoarchaeota archaeon]